MNRKIWKALGIAVCMLALAAPRAMAETIMHTVTADTDFAKVVKNINASDVDDENVIELCADITLTVNHTLKRNTTIKSKDEDRKISIEGSNAGITVAGEGTVLNLGAKGYDKKLTIEGDGDAKIQVAFVTVSEGATANMYENVTLQNRKSTGNACIVIMGSKSVFNMRGGVTENCSRAAIADSGATFHMFDGEIKDCKVKGDGVILVYGESKFIMDGGTISGCEADAGGGLYAENSSTVTINNGTISECTAAIKEGGGLYATNGSTININSGTISKCTADNGGGLYADNSTVTISGGTISGCEGLLGGGLYAEKSSTVNINNGTISGCTAGAGGGLYVVGSTLNIKGGTISECFVSDTGKGGGLFADQSTLTISGGTIKGNKAAYGGGVALRDSRVKEEEPITNWTVVDNKAYKTKTGTGYVGGGIYLENGSMNASAGSNKIYNNTADGHGADICLDGSSTIKLPNAAGMGAKYHDSGIKIDNWYNDNPRYTPSENGEVVGAGVELKGGLSLVASYKASPVRIEIDANGGVGGSGSQTVQKGTNVTLEAPTKEGYLFKGWKDDKGNSYPAGADGKVNITVNEDMKLTAVWEARTFTVTYVLLNGETRTEKVDYGQMVTLSEEPRTGYTFVGWKDGEKMYHAGETITVTGDMTLTAEWKKLPSAENLPKTGDESPVLLWGAALAVSAAACFMLRRRK